jgi:hypothetical protein
MMRRVPCHCALCQSLPPCNNFILVSKCKDILSTRSQEVGSQKLRFSFSLNALTLIKIRMEDREREGEEGREEKGKGGEG